MAAGWILALGLNISIDMNMDGGMSLRVVVFIFAGRQ